ncbi:MAG TPA: hypothetical protein VK879_00580 [Candidatus Sulfomarinibacteraceae bacterium]|nr:hypothetical protein [Candidatus Sulfomarinibacteraceae bacterium]
MPQRIPGLRFLTILVAAYAVVWIALEGMLWRVALLGTGTALVGAGVVAQRWLGGRTFALPAWLALSGALGTLVGFSSTVLTLLFMAMKTGLHAHGPEFSSQQIDWVFSQLPWWTTAGLLAGVGIGLVAAAAGKR